jgi:cell division protein ZapA (FtsZ GTPase activity inhibitor)
MPYTHRKVGDEHCVYKKDGGAKVGCTKGSIDKYLAALYANVDEGNSIKGGKSDNMSIKQIADKFDKSVDDIKAQIKKGISVEMEHTSDKEKATEIVMDHLSEFPDYYDRLKKMEDKAKKEFTNESRKKFIKTLLREGLNY